MHDFIHKWTWIYITKGNDVVVSSLSTGHKEHCQDEQLHMLLKFNLSVAVIISFKSLNSRKMAPRKKAL